MCETMLKLLLLDDQVEYRTHAASFIRRRGIDVVEAGTGDQALAAIADCDIAMLDIDVPGMTGLEVSRQAAVCAPHVDRIVFSAIPNLQEQARAANASYDTFIEKPVDLTVFVARYIRKEDAWRKMPFARAMGKAAAGLNALHDMLDSPRSGLEHTDRLQNISRFISFFAWHAKLTGHHRRYSCLVANALRGLSFVPSQPNGPYRLVVPTLEILAALQSIASSYSAGEFAATLEAVEVLEGTGIAMRPDLGGDVSAYEQLIDEDSEAAE